MQPGISLIFPAYNEAERIAETVGDAARYFERRRLEYEIIVAADGDDGTREIVRGMAGSNPQLRVIGGPGRRGKGRGIREAVQLARRAVIGYADADNKVPIEEYDKFAPVLAAGCKIAIGSRALTESRIDRFQPWYRRAGAAAFAVTMRAMTGLRTISDTQCGFKYFRHDVAKQLFEMQKIDGYMFDVEILLLAEQLGFEIQEIPIRWRDDGDSRLQILRGNLRNMRDLWRIRTHARATGREPAKQAPVRITS